MDFCQPLEQFRGRCWQIIQTGILTGNEKQEQVWAYRHPVSRRYQGGVRLVEFVQFINNVPVLTLNSQPIKRFDSAWRHICKIAKITDFHYHDLRHTFCSNLLLSGANMKDVKEMIGHSDISMTDRYSHLTLNHHTSHAGKACKALWKHGKLIEK